MMVMVSRRDSRLRDNSVASEQGSYYEQPADGYGIVGACESISGWILLHMKWRMDGNRYGLVIQGRFREKRDSCCARRTV